MIVVLHRYDPFKDWPEAGTFDLDACARLLDQPMLSVAWDRDFGGDITDWVRAELFERTGESYSSHATRLLLLLSTSTRSRWFHFVEDRWVIDDTSATMLGTV